MPLQPVKVNDNTTDVRLPAIKRKALWVLIFMGIDNDVKDSPAQPDPILGEA